jgi:hypothetical protein
MRFAACLYPNGANMNLAHRLSSSLVLLFAAAFAPLGAAEPAAPPAPGLSTELVFEMRVVVDKPLVVGPSSHGLRRVIPIAGGSFAGPAIKGSIVPGGADWQHVRVDGVIELQAKYTLKTDDGVLIYIDNRGLRHASPAVMERLGKGEAVPASDYYFRTIAQFEAPLGSKYEWLNRHLFVGVAERRPDAAVIRFYKVN